MLQVTSAILACLALVLILWFGIANWRSIAQEIGFIHEEKGQHQ
jgi:hypothetical protein